MIVPSSSMPQTKQTSRPPASLMAARIAAAAFGARRDEVGRVAGTEQNTARSALRGLQPGVLQPPASSLQPPAANLRLQRLLLRGGKEHVVEDQPISRAVGVERRVRWWIADRVLRVFRIVAAIVGPRALSVFAVDVLHPRRPFLEREHDVARLQRA